MPDEDVTFEFEDEQGAAGAKKLRDKLKACQHEKEEYLAGWQRAKADLINANRRASEDIARASERAYEEIIRDLIPLLDSFAMAFANKEVWEKVDSSWRQGVEYISKEFSKTVREYGLVEIEVNIGDPFSAELHHSVKVVDTDDEAIDETIARVIQKGYMFNDEVLRPATVEVYKLEA